MGDEEPVDEPQQRGVGVGILIGAGLHIACQGIVALVFPISFLVIGLSQLWYMVPAMVIAWRRGERSVFKGLLIVIGITFMLNAACFGFFMLTFELH